MAVSPMIRFHCPMIKIAQSQAIFHIIWSCHAQFDFLKRKDQPRLSRLNSPAEIGNSRPMKG
jgi:hypothetical protein